MNLIEFVDNTIIYKQFKDLIGEIYTAEVHHIRHRAVILLDDEGNEIVLPKDQVKVFNGVPIGDVFGINVYEATHVKTNQSLYITISEIYK